jgi:hypothetical protein
VVTAEVYRSRVIAGRLIFSKEALRDALHDLGEHQAAGGPTAPATQEEAEKLGGLLRDLDTKLGGTDQFGATAHSKLDPLARRSRRFAHAARGLR